MDTARAWRVVRACARGWGQPGKGQWGEKGDLCTTLNKKKLKFF